MSVSENPCNVMTVKCAECGRLRQEANHWFLAVADIITGGPDYLIYGFRPIENTDIPLEGDERAICSEECLWKNATKRIHRAQPESA